MAERIMSLAARRWLAASLSTLAAVLLTAVWLVKSLSLSETAYWSGWLLFGMMGFLASYNARKKLPYPPLIKSSTWLQWHIYMGLVMVLVFLFHTGFRLPNGGLEVTLAVLFLIVAGSGVVGLWLSRIVPSRLSARGEEVIFERIPAFLRELRDRAEKLVVGSVQKTDTTTLADFFTKRPSVFFARPRHFWSHLVQSSRPLHRLMHELRSLDRYLNEEERRIADELGELIRSKDSLDYHFAMQGVLKGWLFVHIPMTYVLLVFVVVHVVLVYAFSGH